MSALKNCIVKAVSAAGFVYYVESASAAGAYMTAQKEKATRYTFDRAVKVINLDGLKKYQCEILEVVA